MKHGPNSRRPRSRGNGKRHPMSNNHHRGHTFESNGPEVKVRGTAQQVLEKYLALARDAASAGEHITAEGYFQYAEHYYRVLNEAGENRGHGGHGHGHHQHNSHQHHQQQHHNQQQAQPQPVQVAVEAPASPGNTLEAPGSGPLPGTDPSQPN